MLQLYASMVMPPNTNIFTVHPQTLCGDTIYDLHLQVARHSTYCFPGLPWLGLPEQENLFRITLRFNVAPCYKSSVTSQQDTEVLPHVMQL